MSELIVDVDDLRDIAETIGNLHKQLAAAEEKARAYAPVEKALRTVVRQMEGGHPVGHDAFLAARRSLKNFDAALRGE